MDRLFIDKYGVPSSIESYWMEGYHVMDRMLTAQMHRASTAKIPFPPVAGYVGCTHLYKVNKRKSEIINYIMEVEAFFYNFYVFVT